MTLDVVFHYSNCPLFRNLLQLHHVHGSKLCGDHHHDPQLPPQEIWYSWNATLGIHYFSSVSPMDVKVTEGSGLSISKNLLRMSRPGKKLTRKTILLQKKMKDLDKRGNIYTSVLVNLLDIQDSFRSKSPGTAVPDIADVTIQRSDSADSAVSFFFISFFSLFTLTIK